MYRVYCVSMNAVLISMNMLTSTSLRVARDWLFLNHKYKTILDLKKTMEELFFFFNVCVVFKFANRTVVLFAMHRLPDICYVSIFLVVDSTFY